MRPATESDTAIVIYEEIDKSLTFENIRAANKLLDDIAGRPRMEGSSTRNAQAPLYMYANRDVEYFQTHLKFLLELPKEHILDGAGRRQVGASWLLSLWKRKLQADFEKKRLVCANTSVLLNWTQVRVDNS